tara:strand:+ start:287 stop:511 length:225 start_codon:yes stop_codon:yes gene_type:complete
MKKECVFAKIKKCTQKVENKILYQGIDGHDLLNYILELVDEEFKTLDSKNTDVIVMRIYDNIEKSQFKIKTSLI